MSVAGEPTTSSLDEAIERLTTVVAHAATDRVEAQIPAHVALFEDAGIEVIVLKGPVTRRRLYSADERRTVADIDLLVDPAGFGRAGRLLAANGYRRIDRHGHSDAYVRGADDAAIDLHLTLPHVTVSPPKAFGTFRKHRATLLVGDAMVPVLDGPAHVVHLAIHAAVNRFEPDQRSLVEWQRGVKSLNDDALAEAAAIASALGVREVWDIACRALSDDENRAELVAALPQWEAVPRMQSVRQFVQSGTPLRVKTRDFQRLVALQLSDDTLNVWRAKRGAPPLAGGTWRIRVEKPIRLVAVSAAGLGRILRPGDAPDED